MSRPIRKTQAIAPFGPGAMVDFTGPASLIHAGLDAWPFDEANPEHREFRIDDEKRLARRLGVDFFVQPPDFRRPDRNGGQQRNLNLMLPFLRFPLWHVCPRCGRMHKGRYHDRDAPFCKGPISTGAEAGKMHPPRKTFQVRFVAACTKGHIQDFPWVEWVFEGKPGGWEPDGVERWLRMTSSGTASLAGVMVLAEERGESGRSSVVARRSLAGAFTTEADPAGGTGVSTALSQMGANCTGVNPVLAIGSELRPAPGNCGEPLFALLKSAANLYFPSVVSSIYIPDINDNSLPQDLLDLLDDRDIRNRLREGAMDSDNGLVSVRSVTNALAKYHPESTVQPAVLAEAANRHLLHGILLEDRKTRTFLDQRIKTAQDGQLPLGAVEAAVRSMNWSIDPALLLDALRAQLSGHGKNGAQESDDSMIEEASYRQQEYRVFSRDLQVGYPKTDLDIRGADLAQYDTLVRDAFSRIGLLHKLRETRAFEGFSRLYSTGLTRNEQRALFMEEQKNWLPAIVVRGEGIFLQFSETRLQKWVDLHGADLEGRLSLMRQNMDALAVRRHQEPRAISPRFVLLHTFAHLLINQLVQNCGYGSASLRERIYSAEGDSPMAGILIYTAAGDSEGTMGGLVRMGQQDRLEEVIRLAIDKARWCSTDPVCIESKGQGPDNCNLAACHTCALLPETSCEEQNRLLDRGVVVGTIDNPAMGFFADWS
ncbi:MAG: DUF1998 domain-containing protein [Thiobacillus sp.]|jgi:hypothetical protein|uniref:DUF1998 domain-containing protein n=1 Tax=Thiobacillus sp. TaxID=924 RepID=UPI0028939C15|nr:DUF1998 domain-containing protein [Thiobacillus sp.]MDT3706279.1 DUF1998 domain-containing protein [Thiobacillus sp.]